MNRREEILHTLSELKPELKRRFLVQRLAVFGSWARGEQHETSDLDLLVEVDPAIGLELVTLAESLERALGIRVDLVSRRSISSRSWKLLEPELIDV
ncbi:MAG: nucleotidyltransferase domain-containing protein [Candidatus Wallbacteria bacterium]|nr:nucleotidyltransferase domain-containing protein [Candidatus Wallbacteria bacterium]